MKDLDDLEKAVTHEGMNWDDFKNNIRNKLLTQEVIRSEVGSHITIGQEDAKKYYEEHKNDYVKPDEVALRAIELSTEGKDEAGIAEQKKKAEDLLKRINDGEDFAVARQALFGRHPRPNRAATWASTSAASFPRNWKTRSLR